MENIEIIGGKIVLHHMSGGMRHAFPVITIEVTETMINQRKITFVWSVLWADYQTEVRESMDDILSAIENYLDNKAQPVYLVDQL